MLTIVILSFYIIPIGLYFFKNIRKKTRTSFLIIPVVFTLLFISIAVIDNYHTEFKHRKFPEVNNITFLNSTNEVRDSIDQLRKLMIKLPKRADSNIVSYHLDKHPERYNSFTFNYANLGNIDYLEQSNNFRESEVTSTHLIEGDNYFGFDKFPFDTLSDIEAQKFIKLIKYLDQNKLNAADLDDDGFISFHYNDSLRMSDNMGFRTIALDTSRYSFQELYKIIDNKDGFYLILHK